MYSTWDSIRIQNFCLFISLHKKQFYSNKMFSVKSLLIEAGMQKHEGGVWPRPWTKSVSSLSALGQLSLLMTLSKMLNTAVHQQWSSRPRSENQQRQVHSGSPELEDRWQNKQALSSSCVHPMSTGECSLAPSTCFIYGPLYWTLCPLVFSTQAMAHEHCHCTPPPSLCKLVALDTRSVVGSWILDCHHHQCHPAVVWVVGPDCSLWRCHSSWEDLRACEGIPSFGKNC